MNVTSAYTQADMQAALDVGDSLHFEAGTYELGSGAIGLRLSKFDSHITCSGNVLLEYSGTGVAIESSPGHSGRVSGLRIKGVNLGTGIRVASGAIRLRDFEIRNFEDGIYFESAQVIKISDGFIQTCNGYGITANTANAQNHVSIQNIKFRYNGCHIRLHKAKNVHIGFCDLENASGSAMEFGSSGGGSFQKVVVDGCWFERNNTAFEPVDNKAEVSVISTPGLTVRMMRFRDCYWGLVSSQSGSVHSTERLRLGTNASADDDSANTIIEHCHPVTLVPDLVPQ